MPEPIVISSAERISREGTHQWRETTDRRILIFPRYQGKRPEFHGFFELGEFEAAVWRLLEKPMTVVELCAALQEQLARMGDVEVPDEVTFREEVSNFV